MKKFYPAGSIHDLKPGKGKKIRIKRRTIALFNFKNKVYAIQNNCPHQNADLADGYTKDGKVYCALHHWAFDLVTGAYSFNPNVFLNTFEVKIEDDMIFVGFEAN
jgi:nitrite reductase/ring-hydroxylating ferredoxin subunit